MENNIIVQYIDKLIAKYSLEKFNLLNSLKAEKLEVFLVGLPKNGKTTFVNAFLGFSRNELYESSKKATRCIFKISYGDKSSYKVNNEELKSLPESLEDRKELIKYLNSAYNFVELFFPVEILININIYDAPGLFSGDQTDNYINFIIDSSDLLLFLKNSDEMCSPYENEFIKSCISKGTSYVILFSFMDLLDRELKNNSAKCNEYFTNKLTEYPGNPVYFPVSSEEFFRDNTKGNIIKVKEYIVQNSELLKSQSVKIKLNCSLQAYIDFLENKLTTAQEILENEKTKISDLYKVKLSREELIKQDEVNECQSALSDDCDQMILEFRKKLYSNIKSNTDLNEIWNKYIELLKIHSQKYLKNQVDIEIPDLPEYDEVLMTNYDLEYILNKINDIIKKDGKKNSDFEKLLKDFKDDVKLSKPDKNKETAKEDDLISVIENHLKEINYKEVFIELINYIRFYKALKIFLTRCQSAYNTVSVKLIEILQKQIQEILSGINEQMNSDINNIDIKYKNELSINDLLADISELKGFINES